MYRLCTKEGCFRDTNSEWIVVFQTVELPPCLLNARYMNWYERNMDLSSKGWWNLRAFSEAPATELWITSRSEVQLLLWPYHPLMSNSVSGLSLVNSFMWLFCFSVWHLDLYCCLCLPTGSIPCFPQIQKRLEILLVGPLPSRFYRGHVKINFICVLQRGQLWIEKTHSAWFSLHLQGLVVTVLWSLC